MPSPSLQPLPLEDLRRLVAAAACGEARAQTELHARYFPLLETTVLPRAYRFAFVERGDLLNDLWIKLFENHGKKLRSIELRSESSFVNYLRTMMRGELHDLARREGRLVLTDPSLLDRAFSPDATPEDVLIADELVALIQEDLTPGELAVWNPWVMSQISDRKEVARRLRTTTNNVYQVILRIRAKILERLRRDRP